MFQRILETGILSLILMVPTAFADDWGNARPDAHAPLGVMGDHTHQAGEWMTSYRFMYMDMEGNRTDDDDVSTAEVLADFMVTPLDMQMEMHMVSVMYAPVDEVTLMVMVPYVSKEMAHRTRMGAQFTTKTEGVGDIRLGTLVPVYHNGNHKVHLNAGVSLPTGSIRERGDTPAAKNAKLPYPMQLGSGTLDLMPGITYNGQSEHLSWGSQIQATLRTGTNAENYRLGHQADVHGWGAVKLTDWLSTSGRLTGSFWGDINGFDPDLNPRMIATADPRRRGGSRLDLGLGVNTYIPEGALKGVRIAAEAVWPLYQNLEGPQLEQDWSLTVGAQVTF